MGDEFQWNCFIRVYAEVILGKREKNILYKLAPLWGCRMPFPYHLDKDPKPVMDDSRLPKGGHHNGKDINILVVGLKGVGKSGRFSNFF